MIIRIINYNSNYKIIDFCLPTLSNYPKSATDHYTLLFATLGKNNDSL